jgi:S-DNA-T family DNA segregation ATPase FtsK/SpoIIIE
VSESSIRRELASVALTLFALFLVGALVFQRVPPSGVCFDAGGPFGPIGTAVRCLFVGAVGVPGALLVALASVLVALRLIGRFGGATTHAAVRAAVLASGVVLLVPVAIGLANGGLADATSSTGLWGAFVAHYLRKFAGAAGAWIVWVLAVSALTVLTIRWNPLRVVMAPVATGRRAATSVSTDAAKTAVASKATLAERLAPEPEELPAIDPALARDVLRDASRDRTPARGAASVDVAPDESARAEPGEGARGKTARARKPLKADGETADLFAESVGTDPLPANDPSLEELPATALLAPPPARRTDDSRAALDQAGAKLLATLRTFKVDGELVGRTTGPTVTQFEIEPAAGVKVRQIAALADDLALAMRAPSIRIVAPIPGRGAVGVEVPNPVPETVALREVLESREFQSARAALPIALGKDLEGRPVVADLARMPHLLIAGATGSGKSVCVNTIITSLVYRHTPKTLRFLMVDPKMVELSVYNTLPHLRHKVITDNRDAAAVLKWAVMEMQDRYRLLEANGCRNLQEFNKRAQAHDAGEGPALKTPRNPDVAFEDRTYTAGPLPYIVVVIDEMADLMMTVQGEVETPIAMLAQKARAIGIHLILATQRPSVNVITGLIKANFPCRIAFRVASQVDSRTIIDGAGAEMLLGNGDMLFIPPGKSEPSRLQGAFLSSEETEQLLGWFEAQKERRLGAAAGPVFDAEPDILEAVRALDAKDSDDDAADAPDGDRDSRFREAAELVIQQRQGSTSLLQRRMKIGYGRAARIIDQLEDAGVLAPSEGASKPRDVLVGMADLDRICGRTDD